MIKKVQIKGFKSLKKVVDLEMRPLNVLIGPNNGGKTNFIDFFRLLSEGAAKKLAEGFVTRGGFDSVLYAGSTEKKIAWEITLSGIKPDSQLSYTYSVELIKKGYSQIVEKEELKERGGLLGKRELTLLEELLIKVRSLKDVTNDELITAQISDPFGYPISFELQQYLKSWGFYSEFSTDLDSPLRKAQPLRAGLRVSPSGDNLFSVLHHMKERHQYRDTYNEILKTVKVIFPTLEDLHFPPEAGEGKIALAWEGSEFPKEFPSYSLSDGVLKFLCLTTLLLSPNPPKLICIDEPEIGLHPRSIDLISELLTACSQRSQLIVATHSPQIIRKLKPEDVLIVERKDGATELQRLSAEELKSWLKDFTLEELWLTGVIGGR